MISDVQAFAVIIVAIYLYNHCYCSSVIRDKFFIDNDKPTVTSNNNKPIENEDTVTLTCGEATSDTPTVYEWYKGSNEIGGATSKTYTLSDNKRADSGDYACKVTTTNRPISEKSDGMTVTFLCKFFFLSYSTSLTLL